MAIQIQTQQSALDSLIARWEAKAETDGKKYVELLNDGKKDEAMFHLGQWKAYGKVATELRHAVHGLTAEEKLSREMTECFRRGMNAEQAFQHLLPMMLAASES